MGAITLVHTGPCQMRVLIMAQVCIPMNPSSIWSFDPESVVTVHELLGEDRGSPKAKAAAQAMHAALQTFRGCFLDDLAAASKQSMTAKARSAAQAGLAW